MIGLPANIFYGTAIPTCILVFKKCREKPDDVLFIDASAHFEKQKNQNYLRAEDIDRIVTTYRERTETEKFSHKADAEARSSRTTSISISLAMSIRSRRRKTVDLEATVTNELDELNQWRGHDRQDHCDATALNLASRRRCDQ